MKRRVSHLCPSCGGTTAKRRNMLRKLRRGRLATADRAPSPEELADLARHLTERMPESMVPVVVEAIRRVGVLRERVYSLQPGHLLTQADILDLRASYRESMAAQEAVGRAEAASGQCAVAARLFGLSTPGDNPVDHPTDDPDDRERGRRALLAGLPPVPPEDVFTDAWEEGWDAAAAATIDADFEEA